MLVLKKFVFMEAAAVIATSGSALANIQDEQKTRGLQLEEPTH